MSNENIIINEVIANKIYTKEQVEKTLSSGHTLPVHTFQVWKSMGYTVKKGEHARITTRLWKYRTGKGKKEETEENKEDKGNYFLAKSFLFTLDQVEKIK